MWVSLRLAASLITGFLYQQYLLNLWSLWSYFMISNLWSHFRMCVVRHDYQSIRSQCVVRHDYQSIRSQGPMICSMLCVSFRVVLSFCITEHTGKEETYVFWMVVFKNACQLFRLKSPIVLEFTSSHFQ